MITASEFHPKECNLFVYSSSKVIRIFPWPWVNFDFTSGNNSVVRFAPICDIWLNLIEINFQGTIRLCDMRQSALCDSHSKMFEEPEDPTNRSFFSEIISSISDVKFSNSGRYMISRWGWFFISQWNLIQVKPHPRIFAGTICRSKCGTCTWSRSPSRPSPSTSTSAPSSAASMKTTASLTSLR